VLLCAVGVNPVEILQERNPILYVGLNSVLELILKHSLISGHSGLVNKFSWISATNTDNRESIHIVISDVRGDVELIL
jgi:hypothetical protein